jgi:hypothetical protein
MLLDERQTYDAYRKLVAATPVAERPAMWVKIHPTIQSKIIASAEKFKNKPSPAPHVAAPAPITPPANHASAAEPTARDAWAEQAKGIVMGLATMENLVAWIEGNKLAVPTADRAFFASLGKLESGIELGENTEAGVRTYAHKIAFYLLSHGLPIIPQTHQRGEGRPGPRAA